MRIQVHLNSISNKLENLFRILVCHRTLVYGSCTNTRRVNAFFIYLCIESAKVTILYQL